MKISKKYAAQLGQHYLDYIYDVNETKLARALLMAFAQSKKSKKELIEYYRNYLEANLFGIAFAAAANLLEARKEIKDLFSGSDMGKEVDDLFAAWDYALSDEDVWKLICDSLKEQYQFDVEKEVRHDE